MFRPATILVFMSASLLAVLPGCSIRFGGSVPQDKTILALRDENHALKEKLAEQERLNQELQVKADAEFASRFAAAPMSEGVASSLPVVTTLSLDRLSGVWIKGEQAEALFYIKTLDGRGRFTQVIGTLRAEVLSAPPDESPVAIGHAELSPHEVRDAYRSSMTGTHYKVTIPLSPESIGAGTSCTLRVTLTDAITGRELAAESSRPARSTKRETAAGE